MLSKPTRWSCGPYEVGVAELLASGLGISRPVGAILARRGFTTVDEALRFLQADERHDPLTLPGIAAACELIVAHLRRGSRIAVFGDYDVDGVCSTTIMVRTLRSLGADPVWELPSRFDEGYGLSTAAVERLAARGVGLLVTVDCGISAVEQVAAARAAGLDVVVSDHHLPGERLPDCVVVHPALPALAGGEPVYGCPELCAAGVVLKLCEALHGAAGGDPRAVDEHLDLAALATVCDLVPLRGENRRIVREGLVAIARTQKPGLRALMSVAAVEPAELTEHSLGFRLGPRINAAGRMRRADAALELLLTEDAARAAEVARELDLLNGDRRQAETSILFAAEAACAPQAGQAAIVVAGENWHPGVVGIVASRLVERWRRPCVVIALDEDGSGRGSGRSISPYDLHDGLAACATHLTRFGGHRMAAGVELTADAVEPFRRALAAHAGASLAPEDLIPVERVDAIVPGGLLGLGLAEELESLRPFGMGNPQPTLLVPAARFQNVTGMGEDKEHARFTLLTAGGARSRGVAFGSPPKALAPAADENHDIALRLERNRWKGVVEPRTILRALCPTRAGELTVLGEEGTFWERLRDELAGAPIAAPPTPIAAPPAPPEPVDRRREGFA
nr:single-stranded-DNA-specific exonuclease RecJ [Thermoleophilaceae bacterium]